MEKPTPIHSVKEMLADMNLERHQKHANFHILKIEDHYGEVSHKANIVSKNIFEIAYGTNHDFEMSVDSTNFSAKEGHLTFLSPGQSFYMDIDKDILPLKNGLAYIIFFTAEFLNLGPTNYSLIQQFPCFNRHSSPVYYLNGQPEDMFLEYFKKIYQEFQNLNDNNIEIIRSYLTILMFEIKRLLEEKTIQHTKNTRAEEITYLFENTLKTTQKKRQKIDFYANKLNVSSIYLSECVKKTTGITPKKVITDYTIMEAKSLLSNSKNTIERIGQSLGFDEVSNFTNFFKKNTGFTPNQFRKL